MLPVETWPWCSQNALRKTVVGDLVHPPPHLQEAGARGQGPAPAGPLAPATSCSPALAGASPGDARTQQPFLAQTILGLIPYPLCSHAKWNLASCKRRIPGEKVRDSTETLGSSPHQGPSLSPRDLLKPHRPSPVPRTSPQPSLSPPDLPQGPRQERLGAPPA